MTQALYRRYRPETFADVIGQEHVTGPLQQALADGRVGHAFLFSGPRGCGKTTSARILARCLNCEQGPTPTPCGTCASCVALARGGPGSVDVIEIDAASHGGVDDARDLREKASYGPANSRYRVYIIDEAHMVTPQGFNALLKIVEEPPEHVKFIFATTEPDKVIGTIRSRTHHYPFRLVPPAQLQTYLETLCHEEGVEVEPGVLSFVVRAGGGSVRDSLSVLDQLMAGSGGHLTYAGAAALLGFTEGELLDATVDAVAAQDGAAVFRQIDKVIETGHDPRRFVEDLLERFRDLIVVAAMSSSGSATDESLSAVLRGLPTDQIERLRNQSAAFGAGELSRAADVTNAGLSAMTGATAPRLQLELLCARLLLPRVAGEDGVIARVDRLEKRLEMGGPPPPDASRQAPPAATGAPQPNAVPAPAAAQQPETGGGVSAESRAPAPSTEQARQFARRPRPGDDAAQGRPTSGQGGPSVAEQPRPPAPEQPAGNASDRPTQAPVAQTPPPTPGGVDTDAIRRAWPDVLAAIFGMRRATWTFLSQHSQVLDYNGERLLLGINSRGLARTFMQGNHAEVVRQALIDTRGVDTRVEGIPMDDYGSGGSGAGGSGTSGGPSGAGPAGGEPAARGGPGNFGGPGGGARGGSAQGQPRGGYRETRQPLRQHDDGNERRGPSGDRRSGHAPSGPFSSGHGSAGPAAPAGTRRGRSSGRPDSGRGHGNDGRGGQSPPDYPDDLPPEPPDYDDGPGDPFAPSQFVGPAHGEQVVPRQQRQDQQDQQQVQQRPVWPEQHTPDPHNAGQQSRAEEAQQPRGVAARSGRAPQTEPARPSAPSQAREEVADGPSPSAAQSAGAQSQASSAAPPRPADRASGGRRPTGQEAFRAAMAARRARGAAAATAPTAGPVASTEQPAQGTESGDSFSSGASADDEDISDLSQVGEPVIAEVLGGVVINEVEE